MYSQGTTIAVAERDDLDARLTAAFGPADDFARELERQGVAVHAAAQVLSPADFDRLVIGTGVYGR